MVSNRDVQAKPAVTSLRRSSRNVTVKNKDAEAVEETRSTVEEEQTLEENSDSEERGRPQDTEKQGECDGGEEVPPEQVTAVRVEEPAERGRDNASIKRKRETSISSTIPKGKPKSGRIWKENKKRFSSMVKDRPLRTSWEVKMKARQEKKMMKNLAQQLKEEKQREKEEKRKRREENIRRRLENERKAEVVQVIRNSSKLKRARKKQLRSIEKRDTLAMSQAGKTQGTTTPSSRKNKTASS